MKDFQTLANIYDELGKLGERLKKAAEEQSDDIQDMREAVEKAIDQLQIGEGDD